MSIQSTKLHQLHSQLATVMAEMLKGEPLVCDGVPVLVDGKPLILLPKPAVLKEVREFLKDNGIDESSVLSPATSSLTKQLRHFDEDAHDPLLLGEVKENKGL